MASKSHVYEHLVCPDQRSHVEKLNEFFNPFWNSKFVISATQVFRDHALNGVDQTKKKGGNKICNFMTDFRLTNNEKIICKTYPEPLVLGRIRE